MKDLKLTLPSASVKNVKIANPSDYATFADAVQWIPNLANDDLGRNEITFNLIRDNTMPALISKARYGANTGILSLCLTLHFYQQFIEGFKNDDFYSDDYNSVAGPIQSVRAEHVSIEYARNVQNSQWESNLNQSDFGSLYLQLVTAINIAIGFDGRGTPFMMI